MFPYREDRETYILIIKIEIERLEWVELEGEEDKVKDVETEAGSKQGELKLKFRNLNVRGVMLIIEGTALRTSNTKTIDHTQNQKDRVQIWPNLIGTKCESLETDMLLL